MAIYEFKVWCEKAAGKIQFRPDREKVYGELFNHICDHYDALVDEGIDADTARKMALDAMGSAEEIAPQLAEIHRPFWGYFLWAAERILAVIACLALVFGIRYFWDYSYSQPQHNRYDPYVDTYISDETGITRQIFYAEPNQTVRSDGYRLTLTRAAWDHTDFADEESGELDTFHFQIEIFNPLPWAEDTEMTRWMWAEDSLGNHYYTFYESGNYYRSPAVVGNSYHTGPFTYTHDMWLSNFCSQEAQWIDLHYDRSGRNIVFLIDLNGGEAE